MDGKQISVLLIEDNPGDARLIRRMLADAANTNGRASTDSAIWADRLSAGLVQLARGTTDIVLCDLSLPDSSGLETLAQVQAAAPETPIVVMTSLDDEDIAVQAVHAGAQDYLVKGQVDAHLLSRSLRYANERKQLAEKLRRNAVELEQRNAELDAFAHTVAHDLKNPVAGIIGLAQLLQDQRHKISAEEQAEMLADIFQAGHKMHSIIQELMLLAQLNRAEVKTSLLSMPLIVQTAQQRLAKMAEECQAQVTLLAPERWPIAVGYGPWVEEVWINYLSNALKYGGQPPQVSIGADTPDADLARFWICDQGPGIPADMQSLLFVEFSRLSQVRAEGHGLGLSIVRHIIEKLGGQVGMESQLGSGSTFHFTLPAAQTIANGWDSGQNS